MTENRQRRTAVALTSGLVLLLAALAGYLVYIYVESSDQLAAYASRKQHMGWPIRPMRGNIVDARLRLLAGSQHVRSIFADPKMVEDPAVAAAALAPVLGLERDDLYRQLAEASDSRFLWLRRRVPTGTADAVRRLGLQGVGQVSEGARHYPNGSLAAHVIGCVGVDEQGLEGLERLFDERLRGRPGQARVLADRKRRPIWAEPDQFTPAEDGQDLVLTIDAVIQAVAEEAVAEACRQYRAVSATAIVMEPATGAILAMANMPTYEPARYTEFPTEARRNRAVTDMFPPGSSSKPFVAAAALEAGVVRFGEVIYCENGYWPAARLHDAGHSYGNLTFEEGIHKSSNIMMAKLGIRLGNPRLHAALLAFGFGRETGVWLPGETAGVVYPLPRWTRLSTTRVPFGQEYATTPLQLITAFAAFANGGKMVRPKILRGVLDRCGRVTVDLTEPDVVGRAVSAQTARQMIDRTLVGVVEQGTGKRCKIPGYRVFGKTGTAQKIDPQTKTMSHSLYVGTFLAGAPADNPRVVVLVSVNEPDKSIGYYGGTVAAPAARKILERALPYLGVPRTETATDDANARLVGQNGANRRPR
ncbi:MAG TPA: penicillin-binding protein 2 [Phycisphaerae bacterium]|nr:penicillin-binding protein 2 [Phycisphaerae bacterium]